MGRDKSFTKSKNPDSKRYKKDMARHLDGMALKCVTERINGIEEVIGKSGAIILKGIEGDPMGTVLYSAARAK